MLTSSADCCDGSDEFTSGACQNTCDVLGAVVRARQAQINEMRQRGYELRRKLIDEGKEKLAEKEVGDLELPACVHYVCKLYLQREW